MEENQAPRPTTEPVLEAPKAKQSYGALITLVIVLALIVLGAFYTWGARIAEEQQQVGAEEQGAL